MSVVLRSLMDDFSTTVPVAVANEWLVYKKYADMQSGPCEEFFLPPQVDEKMLSILVYFTSCYVDQKIAHVRAPLDTVKDLSLAPFNVPQWALDIVYDLELADLFQLLIVSDAMQFKALSEVCAAMLANVYLTFSK